MDLALGLADHVTCLHEGRVLIEADPDAICRDARVQEVYSASAPCLSSRMCTAFMVRPM